MSETPQALAILDISGVYASYSKKKKPVISDINLHVNKGEFFGLIGLNGAGKTTLIKSIVTLRQQDSGTITINGHDCRLDESKKEIAYLPERFDPPWFLSGIEFIKFSMKLYNQSYDQEKVYNYADQLALDRDALGRKVQTYSKGMRQKLGIMATVLTNCSLLILDEPMSGLDPLARSRVKDMLVDIRKDNRTVFLSSHILADMDEICDRIAVLHAGHIQFTGTPAALKDKTSSENLERAFLQHIENYKAA